MKQFRLSIAAIAMVLCTAASAGEATLAKAVVAYNELPSRARTLAIGSYNDAPGIKATRLPVWLTEMGLTDREATATVAAFGVYGDDYVVNYRSRNWGKAAVIAGGVADTLLNTNARQRVASLPDAESNLAPSFELIELRRTKLLGTMKDMGTCSGALAAAVRKAIAVRVADDATRLLAKAQRDLGASALPPDDSCLS